MAVDEEMLERVADGGGPELRFYQWDEPTLSLGYFQPLATRDSHLPSKDICVVRRSTGGGALVHHHELTYSLALPDHVAPTRDPTALTCLVHKALIETIGELGGDTTRLSTCGEPAASRSKPEPFLCFLRRSPGDLLVTDSQSDAKSESVQHKVCGSAQRRRRAALLQHGGVLLKQSEFAPELPGLIDLEAIDPAAIGGDQVSRLSTLWGHKILEKLDLEIGQITSGTPETSPPGNVFLEKFSSRQWLARR